MATKQLAYIEYLLCTRHRDYTWIILFIFTMTIFYRKKKRRYQKDKCFTQVRSIDMRAETQISSVPSWAHDSILTLLPLQCWINYKHSMEFLFVFYGRTHGIWKFLDQGLNPSHSCDLCHSCGDAGSLTHCTRRRIKPAPPQWPKPLQLVQPTVPHQKLQNFNFLTIMMKLPFLFFKKS